MRERREEGRGREKERREGGREKGVEKVSIAAPGKGIVEGLTL